MTSRPTWSDLLDAIPRAMRENPSWRYGQTLFNVVLELRPDIAERLRGSALDPFYDNGLAEPFLNAVWDQWTWE